MKLILSGGGSGEQTTEMDEFFSNQLDKEKPLLYIPIAIDSVKFPYSACLAWLKKSFDKLGVTKYHMLTEMNLESIKDINAYSGIYIGGGNTFYLLKKLREFNFLNLINTAIDLDIPIFGGSAGAIIFAKSIETSAYFDKNSVGLTDLTGLNKIRGSHLFCHYSEDKDSKIKEIIKQNKLNTSIALPENCALSISSHGIRVIGKDSAWIFNSDGIKKELKVNSIF